MDLGAWLGSLSLERYAPRFRAHNIGGDSLAELTDADLARIGIPASHRGRLLTAIAALNTRADTLPAPTATAERRQLTLMFCDLVGSTALSSRLDPEDMREVFDAYHRCCADQIAAAGGVVAKYMGDGVLAYFGYPQAQEDDPRRAIHAGLSIASAVPALKTESGEPLAVRVGIATGLVVVGDLLGGGAASERAVVGETPNLASRLQGVARPNQVIVAQATRELARAAFQFRELGPLSLKGLSRQESAWEVVAPQAAWAPEPEAAPATPLVGRDDELAQILASWEVARGGAGQTVEIIGDPGLGKSRLVWEARRHIARQPHVWLAGGGAPLFSNTPFHPIGEMIRRRLGRRGALAPEAVLSALRRDLGALGLGDDAVTLVAGLIGPDVAARLEPSSLPAEARRSALLDTLAAWLVRTAQRWPTVMVVEDLHWVDPSTLELLERLEGLAPGAPLLLLYSRRAEGLGPVPGRTAITLRPLAVDEARRVVTQAGGRPMASDLVDRLVARSQGVPLFLEELTRLMVQGGGAAERENIPTTLSDLLTARLDRLGPARHLAQVAAVLGGEFPVALLAALSGVSETELERDLQVLTAADVLREHMEGGRRGFRFKHALLRDAAYAALLKTRRRELHLRAARTIIAQLPEIADEQPELLAQHWSGARRWPEAVAAWREAGRQAFAERAFAEAQRAYEQALEALAQLAPTAERDRQELSLQSALAEILRVTQGYSAEATVRAMRRARELAALGGDVDQQMQRAFGEWAALSSAGSYRASLEPAEHFLQLARTAGSPSALGYAHMALMTSHYRAGDLAAGEDDFLTGQGHFVADAFVQRPGSVAHTFGDAAVISWLLDDDDAAQARIRHALAVGVRNANPYDLAFSVYMGGVVALLTGDARTALRRADEAIRLSDEHGFKGFSAIGRVVKGRAEAVLGAPVEGVEGVNEGLRRMSESHSRAAITMHLTWLAQSELQAGWLDRAAESFERALRENPQELFFRPETLRLRGDLRRKQDDLAGAERDYRDALTLARSIGARRFHRLAAASLQSLGATAFGVA